MLFKPLSSLSANEYYRFKERVRHFYLLHLGRNQHVGRTYEGESKLYMIYKCCCFRCYHCRRPKILSTLPLCHAALSYISFPAFPINMSLTNLIHPV